MKTFLQQRWGKGSLELLARHLQCITTMDPASSSDLLFLTEGEAFFLSYEDSQETVTLCVRLIKAERRLVICNNDEALKGGIILPAFYRRGILPLHDLYAQNYLASEGDPSLTRHLVNWLYRSKKMRSIPGDRSISSITRAGRYWIQFILVSLQRKGGER